MEDDEEQDKRTKIRSQEDQDELDKEELLYFLVIFVIIGYGAVVRGVLRATGLPLPYTVVLMLSGFRIGFISREYCHYFQKYTAIARTPPSVILFTFLPILIFESAFAIPVHTFMRSAGQVSHCSETFVLLHKYISFIELKAKDDFYSYSYVSFLSQHFQVIYKTYIMYYSNYSLDTKCIDLALLQNTILNMKSRDDNIYLRYGWCLHAISTRIQLEFC